MPIPQIQTTEKYLTAADVQYILLDVWTDAKDTAIAGEINDMIQSTLTRNLYLADEIVDLLDRVVTAVIDANEAAAAGMAA